MDLGIKNSPFGGAAGSTPEEPSPQPPSASASTSSPSRREDSQGSEMAIAIWILTSVSGVFLALRIYCKFLKKRGLWWDDHVLLASWLALQASTLTTFINIRINLFGEHLSEIPPSTLPKTSLLNTIATSLTILAAVWSKTSFGMTLLRIISGRRTRLFVWSILVSMNLAMSVNVVTTWVQCYPPALGVDGTSPGLKCWDGRIGVYYGIFAGAYSGLMDIVLALLPWSVLWNLQIRRKEKIGIAVAMGMGVFAGGAAFVKCSKIPVMLDGDFTYESHPLVIWGSAEVAITIVAASIPVLRVLIRELREATTRRRYGYGIESSAAPGSNNRGPVTQKSKKNLVATGTEAGAESGTEQLQRSNSMIVTVTSGYKRGRTSSGSSSSLDKDVEAGSSMSSEEKRLSDLNPGKIVQTQEITVRYFEKDDDDVKRMFEGM